MSAVVRKMADFSFSHSHIESNLFCDIISKFTQIFSSADRFNAESNQDAALLYLSYDIRKKKVKKT